MRPDWVAGDEGALQKLAQAVPDPREFVVGHGLSIPDAASVIVEITSSDPTDVPPRPACYRQCFTDSTGRQTCITVCI